MTLGPGESTPVELHCDFGPGRVLVDPDVMVLMLDRKLAVHEF